MNATLDGTQGRRRFAIVCALTALAAITTLVVRIPIPATTGYFNIGDVFVILAGLWLGPFAGLVVGGVGPTIADAIGYPQFILATAIIKASEGFVTGVIARSVASKSGRVIGAFTGALVMCAGYFVFEAYVYPAIATTIPFFNVTNFAGAITELPVNLVQGIIGAAVALGLVRALPVSATTSVPK